jgi:1-deoxy-D-xylulose-5-phosphate synthase
VGVTVVDPRWIIPVNDSLLKFAEEFRLVVTVEDSGLHGGIGSSVSAALRTAGVDVACRNLGVPQRFLDHATRGEILKELGLTAAGVAKSVTDWLAGVNVSR